MGHYIYDRTKYQSPGRRISEGLYNLIIGLVLCWGFGVNWLIVKFVPYDTVASIRPLTFFIGYFVSCLFGIFLFSSSSNPSISFLGYSFVVVPFGLVINIVVRQYDPALVLDAIRITGMVTAAMMVLGSLFPIFFRKIAGALTIALLIVIVVEAIELFLLGIHHDVIDWIVVAIFCGYIGVDWGRANRIPKTVVNAVDSAAALYIDIINLFVRILRILGRRK